MTIQEIISHRYGVRELYDKIPLCSISEVVNEPVEIVTLNARLNAVVIPGVKGPLLYGEALCFWCLKKLLSKYYRTKKPTDPELAGMAKGMAHTYYYWTLRDLPCFVDMVKRARVPSMKFGAMEYELITLDEASIEGKMESYDKMRPMRQIAGISPETPARKPLPMEYKMTHLFGGVEHQWTDEVACQAYWDCAVDMDNPDERKGQESAGAQLDAVQGKVSQESHDVC